VPHGCGRGYHRGTSEVPHACGRNTTGMPQGSHMRVARVSHAGGRGYHRGASEVPHGFGGGTAGVPPGSHMRVARVPHACGRWYHCDRGASDGRAAWGATAYGRGTACGWLRYRR
jgi:hypothetical protein